MIVVDLMDLIVLAIMVFLLLAWGVVWVGERINWRRKSKPRPSGKDQKGRGGGSDA